MDYATKTKYIGYAKAKPITNGRVYVGKGIRNGSIKSAIGMRGNEVIYNDAFGKNNYYVGSDGAYDYWISISSWKRIFGATNLPKVATKPAAKKVAKKVAVKVAKVVTKPAVVLPPLKRTNQEMLALSKTLPDEYQDIFGLDGKKVYAQVSIDDTLHIAIGRDGISDLVRGKMSTAEGVIADRLAKEVVPIWAMEGEDDDGNEFPILLNPEFGYTFKKAEEPVEVNGHDGKDKGTYWEFGCARIAKSDLILARNLLQGRKGIAIPAGCNRRINSVKIGDGDFTLEILEKMNLGS